MLFERADRVCQNGTVAAHGDHDVMTVLIDDNDDDNDDDQAHDDKAHDDDDDDDHHHHYDDAHDVDDICEAFGSRILFDEDDVRRNC